LRGEIVDGTKCSGEILKLPRGLWILTVVSTCAWQGSMCVAPIALVYCILSHASYFQVQLDAELYKSIRSLQQQISSNNAGLHSDLQMLVTNVDTIYCATSPDTLESVMSRIKRASHADTTWMNFVLLFLCRTFQSSRRFRT
jgi:hypothetical protein